MIRCTRCLIPNGRPDTFFDAEGVCAACRSFEARERIDWPARHALLLQLLESTTPSPQGYHCVVPSSGGKDSHAQVAHLVSLGAKVLVVTAHTCHLTGTGRLNIMNLERYAPTIEVTPRSSDRALLNRIGLERVGDISWPEHVAIFTTPMRLAHALQVPLLFYGENPQEAYGGPPGADEAAEMTRRWVSEFGGFLGLRADDIEQEHPGINMAEYRLPKPSEGAPLPTAHFLGHYKRWDSWANAETAIDMGMHSPKTGSGVSPANYWPWENLDNAQTGLHDHAMYRKYGYGRACAQVSVDIRNGRLTRAQGLEVVREIDGLFPETYMGVPAETMLRRIGMSVDDAIDVLAKFTNWDLFVPGDKTEPDLELKPENLR